MWSYNKVPDFETKSSKSIIHIKDANIDADIVIQLIIVSKIL
jgi:hypothetical protein